ncbi:hypothetical protein B4113_4072 [Geobacillus sp. B4113_201601]|nr:hypothetical protein B4113_4072 [Geobacillus sp. B4113_201601]
MAAMGLCLIKQANRLADVGERGAVKKFVQSWKIPLIW